MLALSVVSAAPGPAMGATTLVKAAVAAGGAHLRALQNADGGWFFLADDVDCGAGSEISCPNTVGVTALGLVNAYRLSRVAALKPAAVISADALLATYGSTPPCDGLAETDSDRPFAADVVFLYEASRLTGLPKYRTAGRAWFGCVTQDFPDAALRADERIEGRVAEGLDNLGPWDAAFDIRAAFLIPGLKSYALAEAKRVLDRQGDWDKDDIDGCAGCELLSKAHLLLAMGPFRRATSQIKAKTAEFVAVLLAAQNADGSWAGGDTQITAYAVLGLKPYATTKVIKNAVDRAVAFLLFERQTSAGGFDDGFGDEVTEVDAEVLQALAARP
jgi:hypothetical protein